MILILKVILSVLAVCTVIIIRCAFEDETNIRKEDDTKNCCDVTTDNSTKYRTHLMGRFLDRK